MTASEVTGGGGARLTATRRAELGITDATQATEAGRVAHNIRVVSIAPLIGEAIGRTASEESVSSLFAWNPRRSALAVSPPRTLSLILLYEPTRPYWHSDAVTCR